ncbi:MAG TPA: MBL fold metallo-hydrolase [Opitutaceae bacterium]|nr:MBL fold metallo-hydrolase [Opitutaceae bacterium]
MPRFRLLLLASLSLFAATVASAQVGAVQNIAPGVYFHEGDPRLGTCNNGWVVMDDYVFGVDANYPVGAKVVIPKIRATTPKPIRFVVDTHFHPDHSFGNQVWADAGAEVIAQATTLGELRRTGAARWAESAKDRPDVAGSRLRLPGISYQDSMAFDDGMHRVELRFLGPGHTHGDTLVWLPHERILFTGDVCVNGSFNYLHDSDVAAWIGLLEKAKQLGALKVCPGHGPMGGPEIIEDQQRYFVELLKGVREFVAAGKTPAQVKAAAPTLATRIKAIPQAARFVANAFWFTQSVGEVYVQLGGQPLPD